VVHALIFTDIDLHRQRNCGGIFPLYCNTELHTCCHTTEDSC